MSPSNISPTTLKTWIDNNEVILIDVREPTEYKSEHINGSILLPLASITTSTLPPFPFSKIVVHCRKGGRGSIACDKITKLLPNKEIYNLDGGIEQWIKSGFQVIRSRDAALPLDRQVQIAIGIIILISSLLSYFYNQSIALIDTLIGVGLIFAGVTGFCGLARLLSMLPWNK